MKWVYVTWQVLEAHRAGEAVWGIGDTLVAAAKDCYCNAGNGVCDFKVEDVVPYVEPHEVGDMVYCRLPQDVAAWIYKDWAEFKSRVDQVKVENSPLMM